MPNGDIDRDGLDGDNDPDKDGDGVPDGEDADPNDPNKKLDTDGDGSLMRRNGKILPILTKQIQMMTVLTIRRLFPFNTSLL